MEAEFENFGFRSMIDARYQSWSSFTYQLFANEKIRGEFDEIEFNFNDQNLTNGDFVIKQFVDKESLTSAYFGRPIDQTIISFTIVSGLKNQLNHIKQLEKTIFSKIGKNKLSEPIIVIKKVEDFKIEAYYLWQYSDEK